jgi:hypothetical protein
VELKTPIRWIGGMVIDIDGVVEVRPADRSLRQCSWCIRVTATQWWQTIPSLVQIEFRAMLTGMADAKISLILSADSVLSGQCSWRIEHGYIRLVSLAGVDGYASLGLWGPGEILIPTPLGISDQQWLALTDVKVCQCEPSADERHDFVLDQLRQASALLLLSRVRPIDDRLMQLLIWLGEKFGRTSSLGISLSMDDLNLTHRSLAELAGTTRVTVTKAFARFREKEHLLVTEHNDLLIPFSALCQA